MQNSKTINYLKNLNPQELLEFRDFVCSPVYNQNERQEKLVHLICKVAPDFHSPVLSKENAFSVIFPKQKFNDQKIREQLFFLSKLFHEFIVYKAVSVNPDIKYSILLKAYRERGFEKEFYDISEEWGKEISKKQLPESNFHLYTIAHESDLYFLQKQQRQQDPNLQNKIEQLHLFYLSAQLRNLCEMLNRKNIVQETKADPAINSILEQTEQQSIPYLYVPIIAAYYHILKLFVDNNNETHFNNLVVLLNKEQEVFSLEGHIDIFKYAQNYCIKKINSGNDKYLKEYLSLYKTQIARGLIYENNYITHWTYKNIVTASLRLKEYEWTYQFINDYKNRIAPEYRENTFRYNMASYYYEIKEYKKVVKLLQTVTFSDPYYHLSVKSILMKIYYELNQSEHLLSLIEAFKIYLNRNNKISTYQKEAHLNLIKLVKKMAMLQTKPTYQRKSYFHKQLADVKKELDGNMQITNKNWLVEKVKLLE